MITNVVLGTVVLVASFAMGIPNAWAQKDGFFQVLPELGGLKNANTPAGTEIQVSAEFLAVTGTTSGELRVTARMSRDWHVYSLTQPAGGPLRTEIQLKTSEQFRVVGDFRPDRAPEILKVPEFSVPIEEHADQVTWAAPIEFTAGLDPQSIQIRGQLDGLVCSDQGGCVPLAGRKDTTFVAKFAGELSPPVPGSPPVAASPNDLSATVTTTTTATTPASPPSPVVAVVPSPADGKALADRAIARGKQPDGLHAKLHAVLSSSVVVPGETLQLHVTAIPQAGWHVYAYAPQKISDSMGSTLIHVAEPATWLTSAVATSAVPHVEPPLWDGEPNIEYHEQPVTWTVQIQVPLGTKLGNYTVRSLVGLQTCSDSCDFPTGLAFVGNVQVGQASNSAPSDMTLATHAPEYEEVLKLSTQATAARASRLAAAPSATDVASPAEPATAAGGFDRSKLVVERQAYGLPWILVVSLVGGFILNFMPCVLPVIGLKIMSFAEQAGKSRGRVFILNLWYTLGMLSVFWILATLAAAASLGLSQRSFGWGEQFNYDGFNIPLASIVFVMGLSFLGVWELPIPGFASSSAANELAAKEGPSGAFFKGVVTTVLATPCSGPGLATALAWSAGKPPAQVYLVFTMIGLGMALPYLVIGAFPHLIRYLPKPGAWMETFKQAMGFVLLGTVVYLMTFVAWPHVLPTVLLLIGLWAGCWWIGRVPYTAPTEARAKAWGVAGVISVVVGGFAFADHLNVSGRTLYGLKGMMQARFAQAVEAELAAQSQALADVVQVREKSGGAYELPWQPFSFERLEQLTTAGQTVLVDFTANWCLTCKTLEIGVLNTKPILDKVDEHQVVTLVADWGDRNPQIGELLEQLGGSRQIPLLAIFPADRPNNPIVLNAYTTGQLLEALEKAGPSREANDGGKKIAVSP